MSLDVFNGSFNTVVNPTTVQSVTGVGFIPKLVIFWSASDDNDFQNFRNARFALGWSDATNERTYCHSITALNPESVSLARRRASDSALITMTGGGSIDFEFAVTSMDADGFSLLFSNAAGNADFVYFMAFGGDDITDIDIGSFDSLAEPGQQAIPGIINNPDFLMLLAAEMPPGLDVLGDTEDAVLSLGMISRDNQYVVGIRSAFGVGTSFTTDNMREEAIAVFNLASQSFGQSASVVEMESSTRIDWIRAQESRIFYLAIKGPRVKVGIEKSPERPTKKPVPGIGFRPKGMLTLAASVAPTLPSTTSGLSICFGGGNKNFQRFLANADPTTRTPPVPRVDLDDGIVLIQTTGGVNRARARIFDFGVGDFTLDWNLADVATPNLVYGYTVFGDITSPAGVAVSVGNSVTLSAPGARLDGEIFVEGVLWSGITAMSHEMVLGESSVSGDNTNRKMRLTATSEGDSRYISLGGTLFENGLELTTLDSGEVFIYLVSGSSSDIIHLDKGTTASLVVGASADIDTSDITDTAQATLTQVTVAGSQPFSFTVSTLVNGVAVTVSDPQHGQAGETVEWAVPVDAIVLTGTVGVDGFRITVTNTDNNKAAAYSANISYRTSI